MRLNEVLAPGNDRLGNIARGMQAIVKKYQQYVAGTDSVAAAPDTSKFRATRSGMINYEQNVDSYSPPRRFKHFVKIGSNVDRRIRDQIFAEVEALIKKYDGANVRGTMMSDPLRVDTVNGTNWGGIGIY